MTQVDQYSNRLILNKQNFKNKSLNKLLPRDHIKRGPKFYVFVMNYVSKLEKTTWRKATLLRICYDISIEPLGIGVNIETICTLKPPILKSRLKFFCNRSLIPLCNRCSVPVSLVRCATKYSFFIYACFKRHDNVQKINIIWPSNFTVSPETF